LSEYRYSKSPQLQLIRY